MTDSEFGTDTLPVESPELSAFWTGDDETAYTGIAMLERLIRRISKDGTRRGA
jgi:hypothetical protein